MTIRYHAGKKESAPHHGGSWCCVPRSRSRGRHSQYSHRGVVILNFPKELAIAQLEAAEVVLAVRIIVLVEVVELRRFLECLARRGQTWR